MSRTNRVVYANGTRIHERLLEAGISERELARRTSLGQSTVRALIRRNEINTSTQIVDLYRCLDTLGLAPGQLLDPPPPVEPDDTPDDDITVLAQLLQTAKTMHSPERLAIALEWDLTRLHTTFHALDARLHPLGLRIHRNSMGVTIRPLDDRADRAHTRLNELRDDQEGLKQSAARVLYAVYTGNLTARDTRNDHQVQLGALKNRGAITSGTGDGHRFTLADDVTYAFDIA